MFGAVSAASNTDDKSLSSVDLTDDSVKHTDTKQIEKTNSANDVKIIKENKKLQSTDKTIKNITNNLKKTEKLDNQEKTNNLVNTDDSNNNDYIIKESSQGPQENNNETPSTIKKSNSNKLGISNDAIVGKNRVVSTDASDDNLIAASVGDYNYNLGSNNLDAKVTALNVTVEQNTSFIIDVTDDFKGKVRINCDEKELYDGEVESLLTLAKLTAGEKTATVEFYGDANYTNLTLNDVNFTVSRVNPTFNVNISDITYPRDAQANIAISNNANGTVKVIVDDEIFNGIVINGNTIVILNGLSAGNKEAKVQFLSDDDYNNNVNSTAKFIVYPNNSLIEVTDKKDFYKVGEEILITFVTTNSTGDLTVYLNGENYGDVLRDNPKTHIVSFDDLEEGRYTITLILDGDQNYTSYTTTASFEVIKNDLTINIEDIPTDIVVDTPITFTANLNENVTGDIIFTINGANYTVSIDNDNCAIYQYIPLNNSPITVVATFVGNNMYNSNVSAQKTFTVNKILTSVDLDFEEHIIAGDDAIIYVNMNPEIYGYVTLYVNDKMYDVAIVNGNGLYVVNNLANDTYNIKAEFLGDNKYNSSISEVKKLMVDKVLTNLDISINKDSMGYNDTAIVSISLLGQINNILAINAIVTVKVNGNNHTAGLVNGKGNFTLWGLNKGDYQINVVFAGDDKYVGSTSNAVTLNVTGDNIPTKLTISIVKPSIFVGDKAIINVMLNRTANGAVTVNVNGTDYIIGISNGKGNLILSDLTEGTYKINATFDGDNKYNGSTSNIEQIIVNKVPTNLTVNIDKTSIDVSDKAIVSVVLNQSANGVVTVNVNGTDYIIGISNGKGNLTLTNLNNGTYNIKAEYTGDDKYIGSASTVKQLIVNKISTNLTINLDKNSIFVGDKATVNVILNQSINSSVTIKMNNKEYIVSLVNGKGNLTLNNLNKDTYIINAMFTGDDKYIESTSNNVTLKVNQITTKMNITVDSPIFVGDTAKITINMNPTINGVVKLNVGDKSYNVAIVNGVGKYSVYNLANGVYNVNAVFTGDDKYSNSTSIKKLNVNKVPTKIVAQNKIYKNKYTIYTVTIKNNNVVLKIGKKTYTRKINKKGVATFKINNKTYKITTKLNKNNTKKYIVKIGSKTIKKTSNSKGIAVFKIENTNQIKTYSTILKTTSGQLIKNQKITLNVNGKIISTKTNSKGQATFKINNLNKKGKYKAKIEYSGTNKYNKCNTAIKLTVKA